MPPKFKIDSDAIRELAEILSETKLTEIEYEDEGRRIRVSRGGGVQTATVMPAAMPASTALGQTEAPVMTLSSHPGTIKSPMVGTAYMCPEPGSPPFVKVGDSVNAGQTLMIIEAMKVMNPLKASKSGKVSQIFVQDGTPVEFGEPLMVIE